MAKIKRGGTEPIKTVDDLHDTAKMRFWIRRGVKSKRKSPFAYKRRCKALNDKPVLIVGPAGRKIKGSLLRKIRIGSKTIKGRIWREGKKLIVESEQIAIGQEKLVKRLLCAATTKYNVRVPVKHIHILRPGDSKNTKPKADETIKVSEMEMEAVLVEALSAVDDAEEKALDLNAILSNANALDALAGELTHGDWTEELAEEEDSSEDDSSEDEFSEDEPIESRMATLQKTIDSEKNHILDREKTATNKIAVKLQKRKRESQELRQRLENQKNNAIQAHSRLCKAQQKRQEQTMGFKQKRIAVRMTDDQGELIDLATRWGVSKTVIKKVQIARQEQEARDILLDWIEEKCADVNMKHAQLEKENIRLDGEINHTLGQSLKMEINLSKGRQKIAETKRLACEEKLEAGIASHHEQMELLLELAHQLPASALEDGIGNRIKTLQTADMDTLHIDRKEQRKRYRQLQEKRRAYRYEQTQNGIIEQLEKRTIKLEKDVTDMLADVNQCDNGFKSALAQVKSHRAFLKDELQDFIREHPEYQFLGDLVERINQTMNQAEREMATSVEELATAEAEEERARDEKNYHAQLETITMGLLQDRKLDKPSQMLHHTDPIDDLRQVNHRIHEQIQAALEQNPQLYALICELIRRIHDLESFIDKKESEGVTINMAEDTDKDGALGLLWDNLPSSSDPNRFKSEIARWKSIEAYFWWRLGSPLETKLR